MSGQPHTNTFAAIVRAPVRQEITLDEQEYEMLKEIKRIRQECKLCQVLVGFREERILLSRVNLINTFGK